jgi:hypothetical protein
VIIIGSVWQFLKLILGANDDSVDEVLENDTNGAHGVVVSRDGILKFGRISIGVDDSDDGDLEALGFGYGDRLTGGVDDDDGIRLLLHVTHAVEVAVKLVLLTTKSGKFLLRHGLVFRCTLDVLKILETFHRVADSGEVGEGAAEPAVVDVVLAGSFGSFADGILCLTLAADKKDFLVLASEPRKKTGGFIRGR